MPFSENWCFREFFQEKRTEAHGPIRPTLCPILEGIALVVIRLWSEGPDLQCFDRIRALRDGNKKKRIEAHAITWWKMTTVPILHFVRGPGVRLSLPFWFKSHVHAAQREVLDYTVFVLHLGTPSDRLKPHTYI